jgi:hypothetical protein
MLPQWSKIHSTESQVYPQFCVETIKTGGEDYYTLAVALSKLCVDTAVFHAAYSKLQFERDLFHMQPNKH